MLHIHALIFFTVLELLVVFAVLWAVWFFKARKLARQLGAAKARLTAPQTEANAAAYFAAELQATQAQLDAQRETDPQISAVALSLRSAYLSLERELAQGKQRDADFWQRAQQEISALLTAHSPTVESLANAGVALVEPADEAESARVKQLFDAQIATISELKEALAAMMAEHPEGEALLGQLDAIGRANREMSMCVSILEDDNAFLRGQISALVHD